ncbi:NAD(P)/FAD-dependent oxidoreductase [Specibacter cremeus]|uniref:NAD(P)/FAD-dependent oxidoreductase n=1 Tax=Specibacter cremeus TaxID=1629051 RepID=UPI000F7A7AD1|nr:FAD-dependent oxidoreductase [Specibacter cremeus]
MPTPAHPAPGHPGGHVVVVGNGQAGMQLIDSLRAGGYAGAITVFGEEPHAPYQRPPLSKDYLAAGADPEPLPLRAARFFLEHDVDARHGVAVTAVDRHARTVAAADGTTLRYTTLVLATGARNRPLAVPGSGLAGIHGLRTLDDAERVHAHLGRAANVVVIGAGFIGLEFAAAAAARGANVTVLEYGPRPLGRAVSATMSGHIAAAHVRDGIDLRLGDGIAAFVGTDGHVTAAVAGSGAEYPADLVMVGVGVLPRTELALAAGLEVDNGIVVDGALRTSDPNIFALGDCANFPQPRLGARARLESVQNATDQARHAAAAILGETGEYDELPWFWSHQGTLKLQIAGLSQPGDGTVLRGDPATGKFSVFCFRDGRLAAVESVNAPADHMAARRALAAGRTLDPDQAADPTFDFKAWSRDPAPAAV